MTRTNSSPADTARPLLAASHNVGYLIWPKLPSNYFDCKDVEKLLASNLSGSAEHAELQKAKQDILETIQELRARQIEKVRIGASWAEGETCGGWAWIQWYTRRFSEAGFDILPNINYTPRNFAEAWIEKEKKKAKSHNDIKVLAFLEGLKPTTNIPPEPLTSLADFTDRYCSKMGPYVGEAIELWNEPNIDTDWLPKSDPDLSLFTQMIAAAAKVVHHHGKKVVLGGVSGLKEDWLHRAGKAGLFAHIDIAGLHGLRGTWSDTSVRAPWSERIRIMREIMRIYSGADIPVWLTEVGFTTIDLGQKISDEHLEEIQAAIFADIVKTVAEGHAERAYWYTLADLVHDSVRFITTGWEDVLQFFFGDSDLEGNPKLLGRLLLEGGPEHVYWYVESRKIQGLKDEILDRGKPESWSAEDLQHIISQVRERARQKRFPLSRAA